MEIQHIKILLKLLGKDNYQGKIGDVKPNTKTNIEQTQKLCYELYNNKLIHLKEKMSLSKLITMGNKF